MVKENLEGKKLIVLEDEEINIYLLKALLEKTSADTVYCRTVNEFLDVYKGDKDIVLLDIKVPGNQDGIDLLRDIKRDNPDQKIIMQTAYPEKEEICRQLGADDFIIKPNVVRDLLPKIRVLLSSIRKK